MKLKAAARNALPAGKFAGPDRSYPVNDRVHAEKAIQMAPRGVKAGNITPAQAATIRNRANRVLGK